MYIYTHMHIHFLDTQIHLDRWQIIQGELGNYYTKHACTTPTYTYSTKPLRMQPDACIHINLTPCMHTHKPYPMHAYT